VMWEVVGFFSFVIVILAMIVYVMLKGGRD
jgi:hypothetical protein